MKMQLGKNKVSVYTFFANIPTYFYVILIPVIQNYLFDPRGFLGHIASYGVSLIMTAFACIFSAADYAKRSFNFSGSGISVKQGIVVRSFYRVRYDVVDIAEFSDSPLMKMFSAAKVVLSAGGRADRPGAFYLLDSSAKRLEKEMREGMGARVCTVRPDNRRIFLTSALLSNPVSGVLIVVPLLRSVGRAVGNQVRDELVRTFDVTRYLIYVGIPPAAAFAANFLLAFYIAAAVSEFLKNGSSECAFYENGAVISSGLLIKKRIIIPRGRVSAVVRTRPFALPVNIISLELPVRKRFSRYIHLKVYPYKGMLRGNDEISRMLKMISGELPDLKTVEKPGRRELARLMIMPITFVIVCAAILIMVTRKRLFTCAVPAAFVILTILSVMWLTLRVYGYLYSCTMENEEYRVVRRMKRCTLIEEVRKK